MGRCMLQIALHQRHNIYGGLSRLIGWNEVACMSWLCFAIQANGKSSVFSILHTKMHLTEVCVDSMQMTRIVHHVCCQLYMCSWMLIYAIRSEVACLLSYSLHSLTLRRSSAAPYLELRACSLETRKLTQLLSYETQVSEENLLQWICCNTIYAWAVCLKQQAA